MSSLFEIIKKEIKEKGQISFERFMEMVLYLPEFGYYMRKDVRWGKEGDYYTAPHLHRLFGAAIAEQIKECFELLDVKENFVVVEAGAGDGTLAEDILLYISEYEGGLFESLSYIILEINPYLEAVQRKRLQKFKNVGWIRNLEGLNPFTGIFLSNELFDSFPVRIVEMEDELKEVFVTLKNESLCEIKIKADRTLMEYFEEFSVPLKKGYRTEVNLKLKDFIYRLSEKIKEGFILTIDYGLSAKEYYNEDRQRGTLLCYYKHEFHENPYIHLGEQDITAHVNFSSLKKWGEEKGIRTLGFTTLSLFLLSLDIERLLKRVSKGENGIKELLRLKTLIFPQGFGESHKVMIQYKGEKVCKLKGFSLKDMKNML